ncbi:hypothetical protein CMV_001491 [Castanea mollissima]|uniref:Uncharacterized protein n=1 Tax=Castanea mollissima TaxID=60419 RepID=A0A8J4S494_9ROSI|nr:hypothetical protein CMV_001491 [Castanea mollissima]
MGTSPIVTQLCINHNGICTAEATCGRDTRAIILRFICNHDPLVKTIWSSCGKYINLIRWSNGAHFPNTNV